MDSSFRYVHKVALLLLATLLGRAKIRGVLFNVSGRITYNIEGIVYIDV